MPKASIQILVCTNERSPDQPRQSCGSLHHGLAIYRRFKDLVRERGLRETVLITRTGCLHHCSRGATVTVWPLNHSYGHVTVDDAVEILDHALSGAREEIVRLKMPDGDWE